jgi:glucose-1-phosphate thymidylyltransferase
MSGSVSVILLAAGYGTRLYPLTEDRPKALLPIGPRLMLDWILESVLAIPQLGQIVLVTNGRFAGQFESWRAERHAAVEVVDDRTMTNETRLGAIRDLMLGASRLRQPDDLLALGTDNLFTWPLSEFVQFARRKHPAATIAVRQAPSREEASRCGVVVTDARNRISRCVEKPADPPSDTIALCVYYFPSSMHERFQQFLDAGGNPDAPGFFLEWLVKQEPVYAFMTAGEWFDIGSVASYEQASRRWMELAKTAES